MKILFTASTLSHIRNFHRPYIAQLRSQGHTVHVAAGEGGTLEEADKVFPFPLEKQIFAPKNMGHTGEFKKILVAEQYDWISTHTSLAAFFTRLALPVKNRPKVVNICHGYLFDGDTSFLKRNLLLWAERLMARRTQLLLVMNQQDWELANRYHLGREMAQIPGMGVDFTRFQPMEDKDQRRRDMGIPADGFAMACTAEFSPRKNQAFLIRGLAQLPQRCHLVLLGQGALLEACKALAKTLGVEQRVHFLGQQPKVRDFVAACDLVVSASRYEGLPFQMMEAMSMGLPLVASRVKGHEDLIVPQKNGLLFTHDSLPELVACLEKMLTLDCTAMGKESRRMVAQYGLDVVLPQVMEQYARFEI